jgi:hypothetical protein
VVSLYGILTAFHTLKGWKSVDLKIRFFHGLGKEEEKHVAKIANLLREAEPRSCSEDRSGPLLLLPHLY